MSQSLWTPRASAGLSWCPGPGHRLSEPCFLHPYKGGDGSPCKAEKQMEGGQLLPGPCGAGEGAAVMSRFLELSLKSWLWLPVSSHAGPRVSGLGTHQGFSHPAGHWPPESARRGGPAVWLDPGGCPALVSILGVAPDPDINLSWPGGELRVLSHADPCMNRPLKAHPSIHSLKKYS